MADPMPSLFSEEWGPSAVISDDGLYCYDLQRRWDEGPVMAFIMLNPSTADTELDDPTISRCSSFARSEGFSGIVVRNLFAYRTPSPTALRNAARAGIDVIGPDNDEWIADLFGAAARFAAPLVVAAWDHKTWPLVREAEKAVLDRWGARLHAASWMLNPEDQRSLR